MAIFQQAYSPAKERDAGFSLMEILVVVFIIGLLSSVVIMTLPDQKTEERKAADDLSRMLVLASREAILLGEPVRWQHDENGGAFHRYSLGEWKDLGYDERAYADFYLQEDIRVQVKLLDYEGFRELSDERDKAEKEKPPAVVFLATGEATSAQIVLSGPEQDVTINVSPDGVLSRSDLDV